MKLNMGCRVMRYPRVRMRLTLSQRELPSQWALGRIAVSDVGALGPLMLAAYRGTVDDEGETLAEATAEVERTLAGDYGPFLGDCSFRANNGGRIVGACMVTLWKGCPLVAHIVVHPDAQRKGIGTVLSQSPVTPSWPPDTPSWHSWSPRRTRARSVSTGRSASRQLIALQGLPASGTLPPKTELPEAPVRVRRD